MNTVKAGLLHMSKAKAWGLMLVLSLVVSLIPITVAPQSTKANTEISSLPFTADTAGETYYLMQDLTCADPDSAGITIDADGITIDGQGYRITGSAVAASCEWTSETIPCMASGVYNDGHDDLMVKDLEIEGFCTGIALKGSGPDKVEGNTVDGCSIHDNGFNTSSNGSEMITHGVHACYIADLAITDNEIYNNEGTGSGCGDGGNGIFIYAGGSWADNSVISGNTLYGNAKAGFWTKMMLSYSQITNNEMWGNGYGSGVTDGARGGIILRCAKSDDNLISNNNIHDNDVYGIFIGGYRNTVEYNTSSGNGRYGISLGRSDASCDNTLTGNVVCDNGLVDIYAASDTTGNSGDGNTCSSTSNYDDTGTTGCTYACPQPGEITSLPFTADTAGETYYLAQNLTCSDPDAAGITIAADNVTIDGQGYKITGSAIKDSCEWAGETEPCTASGIYNAGYDDVTIKDMEIEGFCTGIALKGSGPDKVEDNTVDGCIIHDNGFNTISSNGSEMVTHGIHACHIIELDIINNDIYNNEGTGAACADGGNGIFIYAGSPQDKVENVIIDSNKLYGNAKAGFWTKMMLSESEITNNEAYGNGYGTGITDDVRGGIILRCKLSDDNLISNNNIHDNDVDGIYIGGNRNNVENNVSSDNDRYGINIGRSDGSCDNVLSNNQTCGNGENDISVTGGVTGNSGNNNTCNSTDNYSDDGAEGCAYLCEDDESDGTTTDPEKSGKSDKGDSNTQAISLWILLAAIAAVVLIVTIVLVIRRRKTVP